MQASLTDTRSGLAWRAQAGAVSPSPTLLRALLLAGCALTVVIAVSYGSPEPYLRDDRELAFLLRGMAAIKACLVIATAGVLWWRFGHPIGRGAAAAYLLGAFLTAVACGLIWQLTLIVPAAVAFHVGAFMLLFVAYVERDTARLTTRSFQAAVETAVSLSVPSPSAAASTRPARHSRR
jgi:hypothetical protein